jgi:hypothetical protein
MLFVSVLIPMTTMSASKPVKKYKAKELTLTNVPFIHAGAGEHYPAMGYDEDGWSCRGYMSSSEMRGEHLPKGDMIALQRLEQRKAKVRKDFVDSMSKKAVRICRHYDIPPSILVAQAILESNYGTSRLSNTANNLFGHMSGSTTPQKGIEGRMKAFDKNVAGKTKSYHFRMYETIWWSMHYHLKLIEGKYAYRLIKADSKRESYMAALCGCKDKRMLASDAMWQANNKGFLYAGACAWTAKDGVTSRYIAELRFIIQKHNLDKLDGKT